MVRMLASETVLKKLRVLLLQARNNSDPMKEHEQNCFVHQTGLEAQQFLPHNLVDGIPSPKLLKKYDVLMVGGSGDFYVSKGDLPLFYDFLEFLHEIIHIGHPTFASCFGYQSLVAALGGEIVYDVAATEVGTYDVTLTKEGEKDIKTVVFKTDNFPNDSCPMTLNDFSSGDKVSQLPCGHIFEPDAIIKWLKKENASCPVCREPLQSKEIKKNLLSTIRDSSFNRLTPSRIITRPPRNTILSLMGRRIQREEEEELQVAIMESLRMSTNNTNDSNND